MIKVDAEVGKILTASLDAKGRANMAHAIAHQVNAPRYLKLAIKKVLTALREGLLDGRNQAVHGIHFTAARPDAVMIEMHRGKGGRQQRPQLDSDLAALGTKINLIAVDFDHALARYGRELLGVSAEQSAGLRAVDIILAKTRAATAEGLTSASRSSLNPTQSKCPPRLNHSGVIATSSRAPACPESSKMVAHSSI